MEGAVEIVRNEQKDAPRQAFHDGADAGSLSKPNGRQKAIIVMLARDAGLTLDVDKIDTAEQAARLIDRLRALCRRMGGPSRSNPRAAFGLVVKLVFQRYVQLQRDPLKTKLFWQDVHRFYETYEREQEIAMGGVL
jgi:hypothetical protein